MEEITVEELQLAARNHALPLEALREPITPVGLHYLLIHFDIPQVDAAQWRLASAGSSSGRSRSASTSCGRGRRRRSRSRSSAPGNGRALLSPRVAEPALAPRGGRHGRVDRHAARADPARGRARAGAAEVVFTGVDRGMQGGVEHLYERSLSLDDALRDEVLLVYAVNGQPLPPQHGYPLRLIVPGWYGMTHVKWLREITVGDGAFRGWQQADGVPLPRIRGRRRARR